MGHGTDSPGPEPASSPDDDILEWRGLLGDQTASALLVAQGLDRPITLPDLPGSWRVTAGAAMRGEDPDDLGIHMRFELEEVAEGGLE